MKLMRKLWIKVKDKETLNLVLNTLLNEYLEKDLIESFGVFDDTEKDCDFLDNASFFVTFADKFDYIALCQSISEVFNTKLSCYLRGEVFYFDENHHLLHSPCCNTAVDGKEEKGCLPDGSYCSSDCFCATKSNKNNYDGNVAIDEQEINQCIDEVTKYFVEEDKNVSFFEKPKQKNSNDKKLTEEEFAALFKTDTDSSSNQFGKCENPEKDVVAPKISICKDDSLDLFNFFDDESEKSNDGFLSCDLTNSPEDLLVSSILNNESKDNNDKKLSNQEFDIIFEADAQIDDMNQSEVCCNCDTFDSAEIEKNQKKCAEGCSCKCCSSENSDNHNCECDDCFCKSDLLMEMNQDENGDSLSSQIHDCFEDCPCECSKNLSNSSCECKNCTCKDDSLDLLNFFEEESNDVPSCCQADSCADCSGCSWDFDENFDYNEILGCQNAQEKENKKSDENLMDDSHHFSCVCEDKIEGEKEMWDSNKNVTLDFKDNESISENESLHGDNLDHLNKIEPNENIFENFGENEIQNDNFWDEKIDETKYENAFSDFDEVQKDLPSFTDEDYNFGVINQQEIEAIKEKDLITAEELEKILSYGEDNFSEVPFDNNDFAGNVENDSVSVANSDLHESNFAKNTDIDESKLVSIVLDKNKTDVLKPEKSELNTSKSALNEKEKTTNLDESKLTSIVLDQDKMDILKPEKSEQGATSLDEEKKLSNLDESKLTSIVLDQDKMDILEPKKTDQDVSMQVDEKKKETDIDENLVSIVLDQNKSDLFVDTKSGLEESCQVNKKQQDETAIDFEAFFAEITEDQTKPVDFDDTPKPDYIDLDMSKPAFDGKKEVANIDEWSPQNLDLVDANFGIKNQEGEKVESNLHQENLLNTDAPQSKNADSILDKDEKTESEIFASLESEMKEFFANLDNQVNESNDSVVTDYKFDESEGENEINIENISVSNEFAPDKNDFSDLVIKELEPDIISFSDSESNFEANKTASFTPNVSPEKIISDREVTNDLQKFLKELKLEKEKLRKRKENLEKRTSEIKSMFNDLNNGFLN